MSKITIHHRQTGQVIATVEAETVKEAVEQLVLYEAVLRGANLRGAVLRGANLRGAVLRGAVLRWADLRGANLRGAVLRGAVLRWADLRGAVLRWADLRGADLRGANLRGADLDSTVLDPALKPNGGEGEWEDAGDGYVYGYRTRSSLLIDANHRYEDGQEYVAEVFSCCPFTACHPGLYVCRTVEEARSNGREVIQVRLRREDLHHADGKHRCRRFVVVGGVLREEGPCG